MKISADFRQMARDALRGNWRIAILTGFVASLLGATMSGGGNVEVEFGNNDLLNEILPSEVAAVLVVIILFVAIFLFCLGVVTFIISGACRLGYTKFNLNLIDGKPVTFKDLFSQFGRFGDGFLMRLLQSIYLFFWSLLFIIPGIIKKYSYAMTPYILLEHPEMSVNAAITESRRVMDGNKWRLFCLEFSFVGLSLLSIVPMIVFLPLTFLGEVGVMIYLVLCLIFLVAFSLFLTPYKAAAEAAFYRDITATYSLEE